MWASWQGPTWTGLLSRLAGKPAARAHRPAVEIYMLVVKSPCSFSLFLANPKQSSHTASFSVHSEWGTIKAGLSGNATKGCVNQILISLSFSLMEEIVGQRDLSQCCAVPTWGRGNTGKIETILTTFSASFLISVLHCNSVTSTMDAWALREKFLSMVVV